MNPECGERYEKQPMITKIIKIGNNCFWGEKTMILPGVSIGNTVLLELEVQ
jgi:acetyltransferase-like isoleucine patch superfamily enzyme